MSAIEARVDGAGSVASAVPSSVTEAPVVLICGATSRFFLRQLVENSMPNLAVISHNELPPELKIVSLAVAQ